MCLSLVYRRTRRLWRAVGGHWSPWQEGGDTGTYWGC